MTVHDIPIAIIGGSSTNSLDFPRILGEKINILEEKIYKTPYGDSPKMVTFEYKGIKIITLKMHGWRAGVTRADASRQIFSVFREMGVQKVIAEGGVGTVHKDGGIGDIVLPDDYIDFSMRKDVSISSDYLCVMNKPICPGTKKTICGIIEESNWRFGNLKDGGVYAVTDGRHFESPAEVRALTQLGADFIGQSLAPEVYLAREIGACYAGIYIVVNYAEGVYPEWDYGKFRSLFYDASLNMANILVDTAHRLTTDSYECDCKNLRKPTLLK